MAIGCKGVLIVVYETFPSFRRESKFDGFLDQKLPNWSNQETHALSRQSEMVCKYVYRHSSEVRCSNAIESSPHFVISNQGRPHFEAVVMFRQPGAVGMGDAFLEYLPYSNVLLNGQIDV